MKKGLTRAKIVEWEGFTVFRAGDTYELINDNAGEAVMGSLKKIVDYVGKCYQASRRVGLLSRILRKCRSSDECLVVQKALKHELGELTIELDRLYKERGKFDERIKEAKLLEQTMTRLIYMYYATF